MIQIRLHQLHYIMRHLNKLCPNCPIYRVQYSYYCYLKIGHTRYITSLTSFRVLIEEVLLGAAHALHHHLEVVDVVGQSALCRTHYFILALVNIEVRRSSVSDKCVS